MKITVDLTDGTLSVKSDGQVKTKEALKSLMAATCETLANALKAGIPPEKLDLIFEEFGRDMAKAASDRYKQLHGGKKTDFTKKEKSFLSALFKF